MKTSAQSPRIRVVINTVAGYRYEATNMEVGGELVSLQCSSSIKNPAGSFSASFVAREVSVLDRRSSATARVTMYNLLAPRTLIDVYLNGYEVFLGLIDTVSESVQPNYRSIDVQGSSLGAVFQQFGTIFQRSGQAPSFAFDALQPFDPSMKVKDGVCPSSAIQDRFNSWMTMLYTKVTGQVGLPPMIFANGSDIRDLLVVKQSHKGGALSNLTYASQLYWEQERYYWDGNFWAFFDSCVTNVLNEMWVDCGDRSVTLYSPPTILAGGKNFGATAEATRQLARTQDAAGMTGGSRFLEAGRAYLVMRPAPFDDEWVGIEGYTSRAAATKQNSFLTVQDCLRSNANSTIVTMADSVTITDDMVYSHSFSKSGAAVTTSWQIISALSSIEDAAADTGSPPQYDHTLTALYGHRPLPLQLRGCNTEQLTLETGGVTSHYIVSHVRKLKDWHKWMDKYLTGTVSTYLNPFMRIGKWLVYQPTTGSSIADYHRYYYITTVSHQYSFENPKANGTTLSLERGTPIRQVGQGSVFEREAPSVLPTAPFIPVTDLDVRLAASREQTRIEMEASLFPSKGRTKVNG